MTSIPIPIPIRSQRRWFPLAVASIVALLTVAGLAVAVKHWPASQSGLVGGKFYTVAPIDFDVKVAKDGELAAVNNIDVLNQVEGQSTIVQIVREGAMVRKGDVLVELDSADIRQDLEDATLERQKADADLVVAREMRSIQESENAANLEAAQVEVELKALALKEYVEGTYVQELADAETAVKMADIAVKNKEEDLEQTKSLYAKGFVTGSDVQEDELELIEARNTQASSRMKLKVLKEYTYPSELASRKSALVQAEQALARVQKRNASQLSRVIADEKAAEQTLVTKKRKVEHLQEQLKLCVIKAPTDGLVVYAGDRNWQQSQIIEGAQVRERQQLLRLPDTSTMKAVVRVNESHVSRLRLGQKASVKIVGVPEPVAATLTKISPLADSGSRWWNPDLKEYPVELTLDVTPKDVKPGIGVQAEIFTDRLDDVLAVPLASLYSDRNNTYVFARQGLGDVKPFAVKLGETNETHARVTGGLEAGRDVLILQAGQGRELLERAGIATSDGPEPAARPGDDEATDQAEPTEKASGEVAAKPASDTSSGSEKKQKPAAGPKKDEQPTPVVTRVEPAA